MALDLHAVLGEITQRRRGQDSMKVATMTVVVFFEEEALGAWSRDRIHALAIKHPSRVIMLDGTQDEGVQSVASTCDLDADCVKTRGDWIELGVRGIDPIPLRSAVATLCLPEAPVVLIWIASGFARDPRFTALVPAMKTVVYNSSVLDSDDAALRELNAYVEAHPEVAITDLAYLRLSPWQEAIAQFFDDKNVVDELFDLRRVEIVCGSDAEAYYLLGWLGSRLGWTPCAGDRFCNRWGTYIDFAIVRDGRPRRILRITLASSKNTFNAEIDDEKAEAIMLTVTGERSHPLRARPINNIDIASLVERAILTANDGVFRETLITAGRILTLRKG